MEAEDGGVVEVVRGSDGRWSWVYREGATRLLSNNSYGSRRAAVETAARAYPGVPVEVEDDDETQGRGLEGLPIMARALMVVAALLGALRGRRGRKTGAPASRA